MSRYTTLKLHYMWDGKCPEIVRSGKTKKGYIHYRIKEHKIKEQYCVCGFFFFLKKQVYWLFEYPICEVIVQLSFLSFLLLAVCSF